MYSRSDFKSFMKNLTVVILTRNEEIHLLRCLKSVKNIASDIIIVDSLSTDATKEIAHSFGVRYFENPFINHSTQFNWALLNGNIKTEWVMRLDADEVAMPGLVAMLEPFLNGLKNDVTGVTINRQFHFMGKFIQHGGIYPVRQLRIWRTGKGFCESRWMDEHIVVKGGIEHLDEDIADINLNNISWWTNKHNNYATREAIEMLLLEVSSNEASDECTDFRASRPARLKRWVKNNIYANIPGEFRAFLYFLYRYLLQLGFLDGRTGLTFHFLHAFWYRMLVDAKINEVHRLMSLRKLSLAQVIKSEYGYDL